MVLKLKPYPRYKGSGIPWLGKIPTNWQVIRIKNVLREVDKRNVDGDGILLSLTRARGLIPQADASNHVPSAADLSKYKRCSPGQLVMNRMQAWSGMFAVASQEGLVSPDYSVFEPRSKIESNYLERLFKTPLYIGQFARCSKGIGSGFNRLYTPDFGAIPLLKPSEEEIKSIANFVKDFERRINRLIRSKRRLIELLNEQKQAIIHQAVTRGLDPNVRLKPSGIEWLGDVPEHWEESRLKFQTSHIVDCLHATPEYLINGIYPAIRTADVEPGKLQLQKAKRVSQKQYALWTARLVPRVGDILYTREGERYGLAASVPEGVELCISQRMMIFRVCLSQNSDFVMWQLNCMHVYAQAAGDVIGAAAPHVNVERIKNYKIILPPRCEQDEIASWISRQCEKLDKTVEKIRLQINLLREYRTRLVSDVVTGKLDVRGVNLDEAIDETDLLEDLEEKEAEIDSDKEIDSMEGLDE
jgi:type I restriction enzyme, S subunit